MGRTKSRPSHAVAAAYHYHGECCLSHIRFAFHLLLAGRPPDPVVWVHHGYAVINADLRGAGTSEGVSDLFSDQEAEDYYDLIEWAGTQP